MPRRTRLSPARPGVVMAVMVFVGRERELSELMSQVERARAGERRLVLIDGAAGVGKTALVRRFLDLADVSRVLRTSGEENESRLPYGLVAQLAEQLACAIPPAGDPLVVGSALLGALGDLQDDLQDGGPAVLLVDDAQWSDEPSLRALTFAARRLRVDRVLLVVVLRDAADPRLPSGLRRLLAGDDTVRLSLTGLEVEELRALGRLLGHESLSRRAAGRLRAHTEGNPLYAAELLRQLPAGVLGDPNVPLPAPHSYESLVLARLAGCGTGGRALLEAASVLGRSCALHEAARLGEVDEPLDALETAIAAGLVSGRPARVGPEIGFVHPLAQAAVYQNLGPSRRAALHRRAADLTGDAPARLEHRLRAAYLPDDGLAAELARVGRRHAAAGLWSDAAARLSQAARLATTGAERARLVAEAVEAVLYDGQVDELRALADQLDPAAGPEVRGYVRGSVANISGRIDEALELLGHAWQHCDHETDRALASRIAEQLTFSHLNQARAADGAVWAERALELSTHRPGADRLWTNYLLCLVACGQIATGLRHTAGLPEAARAGIRELDGLLGRGLLLIFNDELPEAARVLTGVVAAARDRSFQFRLAGLAVLTLAEYRLGRWDDAMIHGEAATSLIDGAGHAWVGAMAHGFAALVPSARGEWDLAAGHVRAAQQATGPVTSLGGLVGVAIGQSHLAAAKGDARRLVEEFAPMVKLTRGAADPALLPWHECLVDALITVGEHDRAQDALTPYEELAVARRRHSALAGAARLRGNLHAARREFGAAEAAYRTGLQHVGRVPAPFDLARLELDYGAFLRARRRWPAAVQQLDLARATLDRLGARPYLARCESELTACGRPPAPRRPSPVATLTPQEQTIARLVAGGLTNRQIARELVLSVKTIEYHLSRIYSRLGIASRAALATHLARADPE